MNITLRNFLTSNCEDTCSVHVEYFNDCNLSEDDSYITFGECGQLILDMPASILEREVVTFKIFPDVIIVLVAYKE